MEVLLWILVFTSLILTGVSFFMFFTVMRAVFHLWDELEEVKDQIVFLDKNKMTKPKPPPDFVPLEKM